MNVSSAPMGREGRNNNNNNPTKENNNIGFRVSQAPEWQVAQTCGQIRTGIQARSAVPCSGTTRLSGVPASGGQAKKKARPWRVAVRRKARPVRFVHLDDSTTIILTPKGTCKVWESNSYGIDK